MGAAVPGDMDVLHAAGVGEGILSRVSWRLDRGDIAANGMADKELVNVRSEYMSKCLVWVQECSNSR